MAENFKRISDPSHEAQGFVCYADEEWLEVRVDLLEGASSEALYSFLASRKIVEGIDDAAIAKLFEDSNRGERPQGVTVAKGQPPKHGRDGSLEFFIELGEKKVQVTDDEGNVDFRDLNLIKEIHSGQEILKITEPVVGEDGSSVLGQKIAATTGTKAKLRLGKNVEIDDNKGVLLATSDGHVEFLDPLVSVHQEFVVEKDVDFTTGNLKFIGSLIINGNIPAGYTMEAGKNIIVSGLATGCNLLAKGNIEISDGYHGTEKSKISCEGKFSTKFINGGHVFAKSGVEVISEIVRSKVQTQGKLIIESGAIRGGEVTAFAGVRAKEIGAPMGTPTFVAVGVDFGVDDRIARLQEAKEKLEEEKKKFQKVIEPFMKNKLLLIKASEEKKSAVKTVLNKIEAITKKQKQVDKLVQDQEIKRFNKDKEVEILGAVLDDVTVQIGNKKKKFDRLGKRKGSICYDRSSFEIVFSRG